jgi:hypothetical protein
MKFFVSFLLMALLSAIACMYFPWWSIALVCFFVAVFIPQPHWLAFCTGFLSLFILWTGLSYWISDQNNHILAHRVSLLILKKDNPVALILLTGFIGGIVGGLSALTGRLMRSTIRK